MRTVLYQSLSRFSRDPKVSRHPSLATSAAAFAERSLTQSCCADEPYWAGGTK